MESRQTRFPKVFSSGLKLSTKMKAHPNCKENTQPVLRKTRPVNTTMPQNVKIERTLQAGDKVYAKNYRNPSKPSWTVGFIIRRIGKVIYEVQVEDFIWKRHINQLRKLEHSEDFRGKISPLLYYNETHQPQSNDALRTPENVPEPRPVPYPSPFEPVASNS